ncbi:MAG: cation transporter [Pseudomonadota bacterium]
MSDSCGSACASQRPVDQKYRRILWIALVINMAMFGVELVGGLSANSVSLLADAVDFLGDAGNYALSLFVLGMAPVWRSRSALVKGLTMGVYGLFVLGRAAWSVFDGVAPEALTMGLIGMLALAANGMVGLLLYAYRDGDSNMRSVWLCTRNDMIGNVAVMLAALGVFGTGTAWPDIMVAAIMGTLALRASNSVIGQARQELKAGQVSLRAQTVSANI